MKSDCKSFEVFEFSAEDEIAELTSAKLLSKFKNPNSIDKYNFLEHVARGTNFQSKEMSNLPCLDIDSIDNDQNCDNVLSCIPLGSEEEDPATKQMCGLDDGFLFNSVSHKQHPQFIPDKFEPGSFSTQPESRAASPRAASPGNSQDELVDVIPDADESMSASSSSNSSDILGDDVTLDEQGTLSGYCFGSWETGNRDVAVVCPDYIVYRGTYCTESVLTFSSSSIELKGQTACGNKGNFNFQWSIDDVVGIESQCSERLRVAMVKLCLILRDPMQAEGGQGTSGIEELQFAAVEMNWYKKQEEIMSLNVKYKAQWNVVFDSNIGGDVEDLPGKNGVCIPKTTYFPNFDEPFEEVVYPKGDSDAVTISKQDVDLLQPDTFVNDTIIDFYIKYLKNEMRPEERHRFHFFNSFFFRKLIDLDKDSSSAFEGRAAFQRVRKWTRKVNLFEKDYVFIPVNFNYHWSLIVICHPGEVVKFQDEDVEKSSKVPCILHMDSIKGSHTGLKDLVQSYLWEEWREKQKEDCEDISSKFFNMRFVPLELPQQQNSFDCGLFLLHYVECFLTDAPVNFSPFSISKFSSFLNVDWFPASEPCLKRVQIQNLICKILDKENSPASCSRNPCASFSNFPRSNNENETGVELISERCSPSKNCRQKLSGSPGDEGIEITLLPSSSQCAGDSGLVLREFLEAGATAGSFLDGHFRAFDRAASFSEYKGAMSAVEEDVEASGQFVYSQSDTTGFHQTVEITPPSCVFAYSSRDFGAEDSWNPGIHQAGHDDIDASPETSVCASDDSLKVEVQENNIVGENLGIEEKIDQPRSPLMKTMECPTESLACAPSELLDVTASQLSDHMLDSNIAGENLGMEEETDQPRSPSMKTVECLKESLTSAPSEMLDVADDQSSDHMLDSNGNADLLISCPKSRPKLSHKDCDVQENGEITCAAECLVGVTLVPKSDGQEVLERIDNESLSESNRETVAERIGDDSVPITCANVCLVGDNLVSESQVQEVSEMIDGKSVSESDTEPATKRNGSDSLPESDEQQPSKRPRLTSPSDGERTLSEDLPL